MDSVCTPNRDECDNKRDRMRIDIWFIEYLQEPGSPSHGLAGVGGGVGAGLRRASPRLDHVDLHVQLAHTGWDIRVSSGGGGGADVLPIVLRCLLPVAVAQLGWRKDRHEAEAIANDSHAVHRRRQGQDPPATAPDNDDLARPLSGYITLQSQFIFLLHSIPFRAYKALVSCIGRFITHHTLLL
jgi:hypothetical protein